MSAISVGCLLSGATTVGIAPLPSPPEPVLSGNATGTVSYDAQSGDITVEVFQPSRLAGTYSVPSAQLRMGPVNLVAPTVESAADPIVGDTLTRASGLWLHDEILGIPSIDVAWQADTATDGLFSDTIASNVDTLIVAPELADRQVRVQETAIQAIGQAAASSPALLIGALAAPGPQPPILLSAPNVSGSETESTDLVVDTSDTWTVDGAPTTISERGYRLLIDGVIAIPEQSSSTLSLPANSGGQSFAVELRALAAGVWSQWTEVAAGTVQDAFALNLVASGEIEINDATGVIDVTISMPPEYAGTYTTNTTALASGPTILVPPTIVDSGSVNVGDTLSFVPGLWLYDPDNGGLGTATHQWQADSGGDGNFADLSGATASTYTIAADVAGSQVRITEALIDNAGSGSASSSSVQVSGGSTAITFNEPFDTYSDLADIPTSSADWDYIRQDAGTSFVYDASNDSGNLTTSQGGASIRVVHSTLPESDDQFAEFVYAGHDGSGTINVTLSINYQPDGSRYEIVYSRSNERLTLRKVSGGNTVLGPNFDLPQPLAVGDRLRIERNGSTLNALWDDGTGYTTVITGSDNDLSGGRISLGCYFGNSNRSIRVESIAGGGVL